MKAELEHRKKMLCAKRKQLANNEKENTFLKGVVDDYNTYNKHLISQKEKQLMFLNMLNQYIDNITNDLQLTDTKLKESRHEQREITKEMTYLKNELDDLVGKNTEQDM
jgi:macrodomain Ter protein organizer (MatP/YcbG family)